MGLDMSYFARQQVADSFKPNPMTAPRIIYCSVCNTQLSHEVFTDCDGFAARVLPCLNCALKNKNELMKGNATGDHSTLSLLAGALQLLSCAVARLDRGDKEKGTK